MPRSARLGMWAYAAAVVCAIFVAAPMARGAISAERILAGLSEPVFVAAAPGDARLFIVLRGGTVRIYDNGQLLVPPFLDISSGVNVSGESGLLSIAFPPAFTFSPGNYVYAYYSADAVGADNTLALRVSRFQLLVGMEAIRADESTEEILYSIEKAPPNHNGGTIAFRGDSLFLGLGDGGGSPGFDRDDNAQDDTSDFGKMLRFDSTLSPPWIPEHWAKGLRNPYRFSFDRQTGDLYIGDVGQNAIEEIDVRPAGSDPGTNFGWDVHEGTGCVGPSPPSEPPCNDPSLTFPVHEYPHVGPICGGSVTGGHVYRGAAIAEIQGHYLFADFCTDRIWTIEWDGAGGIVGSPLERSAELVPDQGTIDSIVSFGEDSAGELYIVDFGGEIFRVPEPAPTPGAVAALFTLLGRAWRRRVSRAAGSKGGEAATPQGQSTTRRALPWPRPAEEKTRPRSHPPP